MLILHNASCLHVDENILSEWRAGCIIIYIVIDHSTPTKAKSRESAYSHVCRNVCLQKLNFLKTITGLTNRLFRMHSPVRRKTAKHNHITSVLMRSLHRLKMPEYQVSSLTYTTLFNPTSPPSVVHGPAISFNPFLFYPNTDPSFRHIIAKISLGLLANRSVAIAVRLSVANNRHY